MFTFSSLDTYKISHNNKEEKFIVDYKVLVRLYQPIIGSIALSLYLTLESEISLNKSNRTVLNIARLHKLLQIDDNQFNIAVETLKEYGLLSLKANQRKANDYKFVIYPTKSANEFFSNEKLNSALRVVVDDKYYNQVTDYFVLNVINDEEYVDIEDVKLIKELDEKDFYDQLFEKYSTVVSFENCINESDKREIRRLKELFKLEYKEVEDAITNSIDYQEEKPKINLNRLNSYIEEKYAKKENEEALSSDEKIAKFFESEKSIAYYQKLCGRTTLLPSEISMIDELLDQYKISEGVLNVVFNYYFKGPQKKSMAPSKNYCIKVIEEMIISGVTSTLDAMNYFKNRNQRIRKFKETYLQEEIKNETTTPIVVEEKKKKEEESNDVDPETIAKFRKLMGG